MALLIAILVPVVFWLGRIKQGVSGAYRIRRAPTVVRLPMELVAQR